MPAYNPPLSNSNSPVVLYSKLNCFKCESNAAFGDTVDLLKFFDINDVQCRCPAPNLRGERGIKPFLEPSVESWTDRWARAREFFFFDGAGRSIAIGR